MKGFARVVVIFLTLVVLAVGIGGAIVANDIFRPSNSHDATMVNFEVKSGDTTASIGQRLQDDGLIRNALLFRIWARYKKLDRSIEQGVYQLSPDMTMSAIIQKLQVGKPEEFFVDIPEGLRATQYPALFTSLPNFDGASFLKIAKTGILPDGTTLWTKYWFVQQPNPNTAYALEGYLYPAGYYFNKSADATAVVERLLTQFGEELCPGPARQPDAYIGDAAKCHQNAAQIGGKNIFTLMRAAYPDATDDVSALNDALIISSLTVREIRNINDQAGVAAVYHNRYLNIVTQGTADVGYKLGADPAVQYARDTDTPPSDGKWWTPLNGDANTISPNNPYNTYTQAGMPPGPIANPNWSEIAGGVSPEKTPYYYFASDKCGAMHYATNNADFVSKVEPALNTGNC